MKKEKISVIFCASIILVIASFFFIQVVVIDKNEQDGNTRLSSAEQKNLEGFSESLTQEDGFVNEFGKQLTKEGYNNQVHGMMYAEDDIRLHIVINNNGVTTEQIKDKVNRIYEDVISKYSLDPATFKVTVDYSGNMDIENSLTHNE